MEPRKHESSAEMRGDGRLVLDALVTALASSGFRVERRTASEVELAGPKLHGHQHTPIVGASRIVARASSRRLQLSAELGGVDSIHRLLLVLPLSMGAFFVVVLGVLFGVVFHDKRDASGRPVLLSIVPIVGIMLLVGFVIRPLAVKKLETRTKAALDALTISVASIGADH